MLRKYCFAVLVVGLALALFSCTKRKPEEIAYAPNAPNSPYPPAGATNIDHTTTDVTLSWICSDNDGGVLCYDVYLDTLDPPLAVIASGITASSYFVDSLNFKTTYYWKVFAKDDQGVVTAGSVWSFSTLPHPNQAPGNPGYLAPADGAPGEYPTLNFNWACTDPDGTSDTLRYDVYLGTTVSPPLVCQNFRDTGYLQTSLAYATTHYWKILAWDNHGASASGPVHSFTTRACPWYYKKDMPSPRYGFGAAAVNGKAYIIGGTNGMVELSEVLEYDPVLDTWTSKAEMPTPRSNLAVTDWNNKIYAIGGTSRCNERYDPFADTWVSLAPVPEDLSSSSVHAINGKLYTTSPVMVYDISADDWWDTTYYFSWADTITLDSIIIRIDTINTFVRSTLPHGNHYYCSAVYNNLIYVMGGSYSSYPTPLVDVYDPVTNLWNSASDLPGPANYSAATTANGFIYVIGGYASSYNKRVSKYDPLSDAWYIRSDIQTARSLSGAVFVNNCIYMFGGVNIFPLSSVEEYRLEEDPKNIPFR